MEDARDKFFTQELKGPNKGDIQLALIFTKKEELVVDVIISGSLGCSDHEIARFEILRGVRKVSRTVQILDFKKENFGFFGQLTGRIPWETALKCKVAQGSCQGLKYSILQAQVQYAGCQVDL